MAPSPEETNKKVACSSPSTGLLEFASSCVSPCGRFFFRHCETKLSRDDVGKAKCSAKLIGSSKLVKSVHPCSLIGPIAVTPDWPSSRRVPAQTAAPWEVVGPVPVRQTVALSRHATFHTGGKLT